MFLTISAIFIRTARTVHDLLTVHTLRLCIKYGWLCDWTGVTLGEISDGAGRHLQQVEGFSLAKGEYRSKPYDGGCKYGNPRYVYDACKLYCGGFKGKGYATEICYKPGEGENYGFPCKREDLHYDDGNDDHRECVHKSESCAPRPGQFCCCYSPRPLVYIPPPPQYYFQGGNPGSNPYRGPSPQYQYYWN